MTKSLVVVESPTKVRTIKKYIGKEYNVTATAGHLKDLPKKELGIDIENGFTPKYVNIQGKQQVIKALKAAADNAQDIYLAPDPDREGEAIAFHAAEILQKKGRKFHRVLFHELTKNGIFQGIQTPKQLDKHKYDAQQARRILDRLVGYEISPLLWRKVQGGLSAGRVQSVTVRIICDRERAIQAFEPEEYWSITATLSAESPPAFDAKLSKKEGKKLHIPNEKVTLDILDDLKNNPYLVDKITPKTIRRNPLPPFITSKLQQAAINRLKFSAKKTMIVAQQLYEGIELKPGEPEGLITYMRTDSTRIAKDAAEEALSLITELYGQEYTIDKPRFFKNKSKAQDAHEAIRPTSVYNTPEKLKKYLTPDQHILYTLIWNRFVASQMAQAIIDQNTIAIKNGSYTFTVSGSTIKFPGFMSVYMTDESTSEKNKKKQLLPDLKEGMVLDLSKIDPKQHFTSPPPRFSEASLVKELEENGIGRPSTYATILSTIRDKGYVELVNKYFRPSELGLVVNDLLVENFPNILDVDFTAGLENDLDLIETGETEFFKFLERFYGPFSQKLEIAKTDMLSLKGVGVATDLTCPECTKQINIKIGKNGPFLACSGYPDCRYSRNYSRDEKGKIHVIEPSTEIAEGVVCEKCGKAMLVKQGRYGEFLACSAYPECKHTQSVNQINNNGGTSIGIKCPEENCDGMIIEKKSRRGKLFYGCNRYPDCTFASWDKPVDKACPLCKAQFVVEKTTKKDGKHLKCQNPECTFLQHLEE